MATLLEKMSSFETGELMLKEEFIELFQELIDNGLAWKLQPYYGRTARILIKTGQCHDQTVQIDTNRRVN